MKTNSNRLVAAAGCFCTIASTAFASLAFEGRINAIVTCGDETTTLLYTAGTNSLRVEMTGSIQPNPVNLVDGKSGTLTLIFPHNHSYVKLRPGSAGRSEDSSGAGAKSLVKQTTNIALPTRPPAPTGSPAIPGRLTARPMPTPGQPSHVGPLTRSAAMPVMSSLPMPVVGREKLELKATGQRTNILGLVCSRYELKQLDQTFEVWATEQLLPYQPYVRNQAPGQGPRGIQELWPELLASRKLFPVQATLRNGNNQEQFSFALTSISPGKLADTEAGLFELPPGYSEIQPLPF